MDEAFVAANTAALAATTRSVQVATDFLRGVPASQIEIDPVLTELCDLRGLLGRLQDVTLPDPLFAPLLRVVRGCTDTCRCIDGVLSECGRGPLRPGRWALTEAPFETRRLKRVLESCRKTLQLALGAIDITRDTTPFDIDRLQQQLTSNSLQGTPLGVLLGTCLDEVKNFIITNTNNTSVEVAPDLPLTNPPTTPPTTPPSIQSMMFSFRRLASGFSDHKHARPSSSTSSEMEYGSEISTQSLLAIIPDEDLANNLDSGQKNIKSSSPQLMHTESSPRDGRPLPAYSLFPSPPPARSLPPLPPPKSGLRRNPLLSSAIRAPQVPVKSRARAFSGDTHDSRFTASSEAASNRYSTTSNLSLTKLPPRSSSHTYEPSLYSLQHTFSTASEDIGIDISPLRRIGPIDKDSAHGVYSIEASPTSTNLASRHGKSCVNIWEIHDGYNLVSTIKVPFYVQAQPRSRENFIRSHAIISEALNLIAVTSCFGHTLEIWNWAKRKKVQSLNDVYRWAYTRQVQAGPYPLAAYREDSDTIDLYPRSPSTTSKKPFGKPRSIDLRKAGLPHLPKLPELAYSATGPLLVAAAGPRPPRPEYPPPEHAALLMAWQLGDDDTSSSSSSLSSPAAAPAPPVLHNTPYKFLMPDRTRHPELEDSLPLCLATYGSVAVSVWSPARFRTIGGPGAWQVEPVAAAGRAVLVWDFGAGDGTTATYRIPDVPSCVSPDCRFVAYCDPGGGGAGGQGAGGLVVLDAMSGRELWRTGGGGCSDGAPGRRSGRSSLRSGWSSEGSVEAGRGVGPEGPGEDLGRVTELAFSGDGGRLFVGGVDGGIGVYEVREGIGIGVSA